MGLLLFGVVVSMVLMGLLVRVCVGMLVVVRVVRCCFCLCVVWVLMWLVCGVLSMVVSEW